MFFIVLGKYKKKPTKEINAQVDKLFEQTAKDLGIKYIKNYWTLGRYDIVGIAEARDEMTMMKAAIRWADFITTETLIGVPREEAIKLVD